MNNKKRNIFIITILILTISIGYAVLSSTLNIGGKVGYSASSWDVYLGNIQVHPKSIEASIPNISDKTTVDYNLIFKDPGEIYEFSVDVVNNGTMDVMLNEIINTKLTEEQSTYLVIEVKYYGGSEIKKYDLIESKSKSRIVIKVTYKYDILQIPSPININFQTTLNYVLADKNATKPYGQVWDFDYTGYVEEFKITSPGTYMLEVWGASGRGIYGGSGGNGGYATGNITGAKGKSIYVAVGAYDLRLLWNGGGKGPVHGGDATHIATENLGALSNYEENVDKLLIVAGGGGGGERTSGGSGGGYIGSIGGLSNNYSTYGTGGTQISGGLGHNGKEEIRNGSFGMGGTGEGLEVSPDEGGGGGGGFYGGGGTHWAGGGGGGSGYIGNSLLSNKAMYCYNCSESNEASTKTISTTNVSEKPVSQYAKIGKGYVRITYIR